ncbi:multiple inositol polyphosphate phosphatase 1-like [Penaeus chinensis]|uniref:multiple inositol polyphosphate phosphatase 1-like n=1 Tax=Penaeus chinensis TaxID=139456 RepID=UPI001FB6045E|nr:multiple inositol polyphosphate phosphatase 1-like [Penaeus chinensis]XP_047496911.1 multiple inositol polyphosphate phosphatase 1-like [Penaeus chinensis]
MSLRNLHLSLSLALLSSLFIVKTCAVSEDVSEDGCLGETENPNVNFASKVTYSFVRGNIAAEVLALKKSGCRVRSVWMMARHGSRYPTDLEGSFIWNWLPRLKEEILEAHEMGSGSLCQKTLELLKSWTGEEFSSSRGMQLFDTGRKEMKGLGVRMRAALPHFFTEDALNRRVLIWSTNTSRTIDTAKVFLKGFSPSEDLEKNITVKTSDQILEFPDKCHKYSKTVFQGQRMPAFEQYLRGPEVQSVVDRVSQRIAVSVNLKQVGTMYNTCRYYKVMEPQKKSVWCAVFSKEDLKVLEYGEDLFLYHHHGYAFNITFEQACPVVKDIIQLFRNQNETSAFYFTHLETVMKVMTRFGFFNDSVPLSHTERDANRLWRTSRFGGFGSNLALLLTQCGREGWTVNTYINERKAPLPECTFPTGCPWPRFLQLYGQYEVCPFDDLCENENPCVDCQPDHLHLLRNILKEL